MTDHDHDDADIAILDFVAVMQAYGISAAEACKLASERIREAYADPEFAPVQSPAQH